jgi:hypothetical protein
LTTYVYTAIIVIVEKICHKATKESEDMVMLNVYFYDENTGTWYFVGEVKDHEEARRLVMSQCPPNGKFRIENNYV